MSSELDTLVLESLAEGEKSYGEIYFWIKAKGASKELLDPLILSRALEALRNAGLIERYTIRKPSQSSKARIEWIYRLSADGALMQWAGEVSTPKEKSPA